MTISLKRLLPCLALCAALAPAARAQVAFDAGRVFPLERSPGIPMLADLDRDGRLDLVIPQLESKNIAVFLGDDRGDLERLADVQPQGSPELRVIAIGDLPQGFPDLFVSTSDLDVDEHSIFVFRGEGDGTFERGRGIALTSPARAVVAGDFDGDEILDFAHTLDHVAEIRIRFGDDTGGFPLQRELTLTLAANLSVETLTAADLNDDGRDDLILATDGGDDTLRLQVAIADGQGGFEPFRTVVSPDPPPSVRTLVGDWDRDGNLDLLTASPPRLFFGDGTGTLTPGGTVGGSGDEAIVVTDFDGESPPDLLIFEGERFNGTRHSHLYLGDGAGDFAPGLAFPASDRTLYTAGDVDGDGISDLLGVHDNLDLGDEFQALDRLEVYLAEDPLDYPVPPALPVPNDSSFSVVVTGDFFFGDGHPDVIAFQSSRPHFAVPLAGDGSGAFTALPTIPIPIRAASALVEDFDGNGTLDVAAIGLSLQVLLNTDEKGTFDLVGRTYLSDGPSSASGDFNEDGHLDIVSTSRGISRIHLGFGNGTGQFPFTESITVPGYPADTVRTADLDRDGHLDLVVATGRDWGKIQRAFGRGDGTFDFAPSFNAGAHPDGLVVADLDGDTLLDIAVANEQSRDVGVYIGDGSGEFELRSTVSLGAPGTLPISGSNRLVPVDLLGNGILDLALVNRYSAEVIVLEGNGDGTFRVRRLPVGWWPTWTSSDDIDRDGTPDLVVSTSSGSVSLLLNRSLTSRNARRGTIHGRTGEIADVLLVNGESGSGRDRIVEIDAFSPLTLSALAPPANPLGPAPFVIYGWVGAPTDATVQVLPQALGITVLPTPLSRPGPGLGPREIWKNIPGHSGLLGTATRNSAPAPSTFQRAPGGLRVTGTFTLQGFMIDDQAPQGEAGTTNAVVVISR